MCLRRRRKDIFRRGAGWGGGGGFEEEEDEGTATTTATTKIRRFFFPCKVGCSFASCFCVCFFVHAQAKVASAARAVSDWTELETALCECGAEQTTEPGRRCRQRKIVIDASPHPCAPNGELRASARAARRRVSARAARRMARAASAETRTRRRERTCERGREREQGSKRGNRRATVDRSESICTVLPLFSTRAKNKNRNHRAPSLFRSRCPLSPLKRRLRARERDKESHLSIESRQQQCSLEPLERRIRRRRELSTTLVQWNWRLLLPLQQPKQRLSRCWRAPATSKLSRSS